jgi:exodeoxyribonuclease-5
MQLKLSKDQKQALDSINDWFSTKNKKHHMTLGGYAGTGKTTLIAYLRNILHEKNKKLKVAFCSYTGKSALVLESTLIDLEALYPSDRVSTIHSLIYSPILDDKRHFVGWQRVEELDHDLIIVDEASMVTKKIWRDLKSYKIPILAVGDHGQLPPIEGDFNLMETPLLRLEKIHRQAKGNPIIALSKIVRESGKIPVGKFSKNVVKYDKNKSATGEEVDELLSTFSKDMLILCGYNRTRIQLNQSIRSYLGFYSETPETGDRVICLNNNYEADILNGMFGKINRISDLDEDYWSVEINMEAKESPYSGKIYKDQFNSPKRAYFDSDSFDDTGDLFDFGYAITVHKSQGSQAKKVLLFEERFPKMTDEEWRRWLYTGVTRAQEELYVVGL